jgi:hypothetical protein
MSETPRRDPLDYNPERRVWTTDDQPIPEDKLRIIKAVQAEEARRGLELLRRHAS